MAEVVLSLTGPLVLSKTESSCHQKPKQALTRCSKVVFGDANCANIESYGFFLTLGDSRAAQSAGKSGNLS